MMAINNGEATIQTFEATLAVHPFADGARAPTKGTSEETQALTARHPHVLCQSFKAFVIFHPNFLQISAYPLHTCAHKHNEVTLGMGWTMRDEGLRLPALILAGAPRCGTTSLFNWLDAHPEVSGSSIKEPFYFIDLGSPLLRSNSNYHYHGLDGYASYFQHCPREAKVLFEATTHYMYQATALEFFSTRQPQPHVIFLLRQPSHFVFSAFNYCQNNQSFLDKSVRFDQFVDLLLANRVGDIRDAFRNERAFFVQSDLLRLGRYYDWLARWAERFPANRLEIILFEQMIANPSSTLQDLARKVEVDPAFYNQFDFEKKNETVIINNGFLHRTVRRMARHLPAAIKTDSLKSVYYGLQAYNTSLPKADEQSLKRLEEYFAPHNTRLAKEFALKLECWSGS